MNEQQAEAFLNWAHAITSEVQILLERHGRNASATQIWDAMKTLGEVTLEQSICFHASTRANQGDIVCNQCGENLTKH